MDRDRCRRPRIPYTHTMPATPSCSLALTPMLERWTLHPAAGSIQREVLDPTPRRFAHCGNEGVDGAPRLLWTTGNGTIGHHDLAASRHVHHNLRPDVPGDLVFVADATRPSDADGGWLVGFVHDAPRATTELRVIDAADIAGAAHRHGSHPSTHPSRAPLHVDPLNPMTATAITINEGEQAMNTIHHTDSSIEPTTATVSTDGEPVAVLDETRREPVWRVVGGSLAAGFVAAIVLTLGVFGGAAEHVISGSALLAFAAGWAMLALLSNHFTSQPQRWARVPAAFMAAGRARAADRPARRSSPQHGRLGLAPGGARARGLDGHPTPPQPQRPRSLADLPGHRLARHRRHRRHVRNRCPGTRPERVSRARHPVRRRRSPPPPELHGNRQPHRRARARVSERHPQDGPESPPN